MILFGALVILMLGIADCDAQKTRREYIKAGMCESGKDHWQPCHSKEQTP